MTLTTRITGLRTGFWYQFKVKSVNVLGSSEISSASTPIITALVPDFPTALTLKARSANSMTFSWLPPLDKGGVELFSYNVYVALGDSVFT
jgi:hypothetical protein